MEQNISMYSEIKFLPTFSKIKYILYKKDGLKVCNSLNC